MTESRFREIVEYIALRIRLVSPYRTGNLANNGVTVEYISDREIHIKVDTNIAPYMVYTNEPWLSPKWNGKKNPNEGWWNRGGESLIPYILQNHYNGKEVSYV